MRALRPMIKEERGFAEQHHELVIDFLRCKRLPMDDFYDIVIFGYLSAVQQYFRNPPAGVKFKAMKDSILRDGEYNARAKRCAYIISLDDMNVQDPKQDTERQIEDKALLEQVVSVATPKEAKIISFLMDGFALREAAQRLKMPKAVAVSCMENFYCRAKAAIG